MVHETGEATERFLRSAAFGEVNIVEAAAEEASRGLVRVNSEKTDTALTLSEELLANARHAIEKLRTVHDEMSERNEEHERQRELGLLVSVTQVSFCIVT